MVQKDKVKELVGRGLHSYHTKAFQQMDRIEKKNKEQNHKISILTNELDNDYLTKTEEGSVVSLEHSKEGMIYIDSLEGNTLVNYCTDGAKELTLNGDIDVEGTNVTLTEGVDNGKVDVVCEGNTLVNLSTIGSATFTERFIRVPLSYDLKKGTIYTLCLKQNNNTLPNGFVFRLRIGLGGNTNLNIRLSNEDNIINFTPTLDGFNYFEFYTSNSDDITNGYTATLSDIIMLEGDWTNKEIPPYFEGMKSVGELENNKIEILSNTQNLYSENEFLSPLLPKEIINNKEYYVLKGNNTITADNLLVDDTMFKFKENTRYTFTIKGMRLNHFHIFYVTYTDGTRSSVRYNNTEEAEMTFTTLENKTIKNVFTDTGGSTSKSYILVNGICMKEGTDSTFVPHKSNKKEISLNEPLRGLPNGVKDKIVKIGGKYYVERHIGSYTFTGNETIFTDPSNYDSYNYYTNNLVNKTNVNNSSAYVCNSMKTSIYNFNTSNVTGKNISSNFVTGFNFQIGKTEFGEGKTIGEVKNLLLQWLVDNPTTILYELNTPTYEELPTNPTLNTYTDTTHISNKSTIPCNMKVANTGYNTIIKPSTLYTVALDTDKSGTIGINLGGVKVTTTNNIATITTPATLTDDNLRLYGKGIKASKVRLLEGDKTNWIPSFFEGMQSSFEDKLQEDGTYKMEILSNNKNLFNGTWVYDERNNKINSGDLIKVKPNTTYTISDNLNYRYQIYEYADNNTHFNSMYPYAGSYTFTTSKRTHYLRFSTYAPSTDVNVKFLLEEGRNVNSYEPNKSNKIQFSSIEPLRSVDDIKDRFVFKDGKLMIERNCKSIRLNYETIASYTVYNTEHNGTMLPFSIRMKTVDTKKGKFVQIPCNCLATHEKPTYKSAEVSSIQQYIDSSACFVGSIKVTELTGITKDSLIEYFNNNNISITYQLAEPTYEEIPFELQKIILEGYENGTLFFDTNIPPTSTVTYSGETPIVKSVRLNKSEVLNNTNDINDNIVPYLMDMDYRVVCLQLEGGIENMSMARLFGGTYEMLQRDILSNRYSKEEYKYRLDAYLSANKITKNEYEKLGDMLND